MTKWIDPRTPVSVTHAGKFIVTIYDMEAYNESLRHYSDNNSGNEKPLTAKVNTPSPFKKGKPAARYNWTEKLKTPLPLTLTADKGERA